MTWRFAIGPRWFGAVDAGGCGERESCSFCACDAETVNKMFGGRRGPPADTEAYYNILGVDKTSSAGQIKKAYYKLAKDLHPDKNPDDEEKLQQFQALSHAYDVLSDPKKREIYDQFGEEGLQGQGGMDGSSIFDQVFGGGFGDMFGFGGGGGGRGRGRGGKQKGDNIAFKLGVSLKELYNGSVRKLKVNKQVICEKCEGKGAKSEGATQQCGGCNGRGVRIIRHQIGPGMVQQMQSVCGDCGGKGEVIDKKDRCTKCKGKKTIQEPKVIEVGIEKGMREGQKITFSQEGDQAPNTTPGDIIVVIAEREDADSPFLRHNDDLVYKKEISLLESLTGFEFLIEHMDGRTLVVRSKEGEVIETDTVRVIPSEGMPKHKNPFIKGNLLIHFTVVWPEPGSLSAKQIEALTTALPPKPKLPATLPMEAEEYVPEKFDSARHDQQDHGGRREAYDEEEDHGQQAGCVHQ